MSGSKARSLGDDLNAAGQVCADYQAPYPAPIRVGAGDEVIIDESKKTGIPGWVWCSHRTGGSGWVPEAYLERQGSTGHMRCDYNAIELTVRSGEMLTCHKSESGFTWATNQAGQTGWVPSSHIIRNPAGDR